MLPSRVLVVDFHHLEFVAGVEKNVALNVTHLRYCVHNEEKFRLLWKAGPSP
jgi:hypothetical protein